MADGCLDPLYSGQVSGTVVQVSNQSTYVGQLVLGNTTAAVAYLQVFWAPSGSVTLGTTAPDLVFLIPASSGAVIPFGKEGLKTRGTAWSIACTTTRSGSTGAAVEVAILSAR